MPSVGPLDHPAVSLLSSPPRSGGNAAMGDMGDVASPLCRESNVVKVIALIGAQMLLNVPRRRPSDDERVQRRPETFLIVDVGSREYYPKRDSPAIDAEVAFRAQLSSIGRILPVSSPLLPVQRPSRCPVTATPSRYPCSDHIPANRVSRVWKKSPLWSISGNAHGRRNPIRIRVGASSTGIRSSGHTGSH